MHKEAPRGSIGFGLAVFAALAVASAVHAVPTRLYFRADGDNLNLRLSATAPGATEADQTIPDSTVMACYGSGWPGLGGVSASRIRTFRMVTDKTWTKDPDLNQVNFEVWGKLKPGQFDFCQFTLKVTVTDAFDGATWIEQMGATCPGCPGTACSGTGCNLNSALCWTKFNREQGGNISQLSDIQGSLASMRTSIAAGSTVMVEVWAVGGIGDGNLSIDVANESWISVPYALENFSIRGSITPRFAGLSEARSYTYTAENTDSGAPDITFLTINIPGGLSGGRFYSSVAVTSVDQPYVSVSVTQAGASANGTIGIDFSADPISSGEVVSIAFNATAPVSSLKSQKWDGTANPGTGNFTLSQKTTDSLYTAALDVPYSATVTGVAAANTSGDGGQVTVTWNGAVPYDYYGVTSYEVFRGTIPVAVVPPQGNPPPSTGDTSWKPVMTVVSQTTGIRFNDTWLTNTQCFCYAVRAVNPIGVSAPSAEVCGTPYANPRAPAFLSAMVRDQAIDLSWSRSVAGYNSYAVSGYWIYRNTCEGCVTTNVCATIWAADPVSNSVYTDGSLSNSALYTYYVRAFDWLGHFSDASPVATGRPPANLPLGLTALYDYPGTQVALQWQASTGNAFTLIGYNVYRSSCTACPFGRLVGGAPEVLGAATTVFTDATVVVGAKYTYAISPVTTEGGGTEGALTKTVRILVPPSPPTGLAVAARAAATLYVEWASGNPAGVVSGYRVFRANQPESSTMFQLAVMKPWTSTAYTDMVLSYGERYYYRVSAFYVHPEGDFAESPPCAAVYGVVRPGRVQSLTGYASNSTISLSWGDSTTYWEVDGYRIFRASGSPSTTTVYIAAVAATVFTYDDTTVANGLTYYFAVAAFNWGGQGASDLTRGMTPYVPPDAPGGLTIETGLANLTIMWTPANPTTFPVSGYRILRSESPGTEVQVAYVDGGGSSLWIDSSGLVNGTFYYYVIRSVDSMGYISLPTEEKAGSPAMPPCAPSGMTGWAAGTAVSLTWQPVITCGATPTFPVSGYSIYRSTVSGKVYTRIAWLAAQYATAYTDTDPGLVYGTTYYYAARTFDDTKGISTPNESISLIPPYGPAYSVQAVVTPRIPAGAPQGLTFMGEPNEHDLRNKLTWTPSVPGSLEIIGYNVRRSTAIGGAETVAYVSGAETGTYLDTAGITNGKFYYYQVAAVDEKWYEGDWAGTSGTPYADPAVPASVSLVEGNGQVFLWWPGVAKTTWEVSGYQVYRSTYPGLVGLEPAKRVGSTPLFATNWTDTGPLQNGLTYYYHVATWDEWMHLSYLMSPEASGTPYAPPAAPLNLSLMPGPNRITVSWSPSVAGTWPVSGYVIYREAGPNIPCPGTQVALVTGGQYQYIDNAVVNGNNYHYRVRAWDQVTPAHYSACSATQYASPQALPDPPGEPSGLTGRVADNGAIVLGWIAGTKTYNNIASYNVYRTTWADIAAAGGELLANTGTTVTYYLDSTAVLGTVYYYRVRTVDTYPQESTASNEVRMFPRPRPTGLVATVPTANRVDVAWTAMAGGGEYPVATYRLYQSTDAGGPWGLLVDAAPNSYVDYAVTSGRTVYYRVQGVSAEGWTSPYSAVASKTPTGPPSLPVLAAAPGDKTVLLNWTQSWGEFTPTTTYYVFRGLATGNYDYTVTITGAAPPLTYNDTKAANGTLYFYAIEARDSAKPPNYVWSNEVTAMPLGAPRYLNATAGDARITLRWYPSANGEVGTSAYQVFRRSPTENEAICGTAYEWWATGYVDATALNGVDYTYRVRAVDAAFSPTWFSGFTLTVSARAATPPSAPTITNCIPSSFRIDLTWNPPSAIGTNPLSAYQLYRTTAGGMPYLLRAWFPATGSSFSDTTVTNGTRFYYILRAADTGVPSTWSPWSNGRNAVPFDAPYPPTDLTVRLGNGRLYVGWSTAFVQSTYLVPGFHVYRGTVSNGEVMSPPISGATPIYATGWQDSSAVNGTQYFYKVKSVDSKGNTSSTSLEVSGIAFRPPPAPYGVSALPGNTVITLKWSHTPTAGVPFETTYLPISGYKVYRNDVGYIYRAFGTTFIDTSVTNGTAHVYTVTAVDARGNESPLSWGGTATGSVNLVNPPRTVVATVTAGSIALNWKGAAAPGIAPGGPISQYVIVKATCAAGCEFSASKYVASTQLTWTDTSTALGQSYEYRVRAVGSTAGYESPDMFDTYVAYASACGLPPGPPQSLVATAGSRSATLNWAPPLPGDFPPIPCELTGYLVMRSADNAPYTAVAALPLSTNSFVDHGLTNGLTYKYRVSAVNVVGPGPAAESETVAPMVRPTQFYLSKNAFAPVKGERLNIYFALEEPGTVKVRILSVSGLLVYEWKREVSSAGPDLNGEWNALTSPSTTAGMPDLPGWNGRAADGQYVASGVYLVHVEAGKFRKILKVIVIK